jgi:hypothetical protein
MGEDEREYEMMLGDIHNAGIKTTSTGQFLAWLANMTFDPAEKVPRYYVLQGPPGCGKSSFIKAVSEKLLHPAHVRIYTDVQRLVEMFNGHASENVLTGLEEVRVITGVPYGWASRIRPNQLEYDVVATPNYGSGCT